MVEAEQASLTSALRQQAGKVDFAIDVSRERYPFCVVWTPLPLLTWIFPFIGHTGITDSKGIICDFQGPYFVGTEGSMAFGNPTRYIQLDPAKVRNIPAGMTSVEAWDAAVDEANRTYCKRMHNLFCDNCHSHVCRALQTMEYSGLTHYNMVMLAAGCFFVGKPVSFGRLLYTFAPFVIIVSFWWLARH